MQQQSQRRKTTPKTKNFREICKIRRFRCHWESP